MDLNLYNSVVSFVRRHNKASVSHIQRNFNLGYNRASEIMDKLENEHVVSCMYPSGRREVYPEIVANLNVEINELKAKLEAAQVPEGFVLVEKLQLTQLMADMDYMGKKALGSDYVSFADIAKVLDGAIEAAQGEGHE